jgi:hypothetical protein
MLTHVTVFTPNPENDYRDLLVTRHHGSNLFFWLRSGKLILSESFFATLTKLLAPQKYVESQETSAKFDSA